MPFTHTNDLIEALMERLKSLKLDAANAPAGEALFQRVGAFGANRLVEAMKSVFAAEQRVCFIVPGGDGHSNQRDRNLLFSQRNTRIALLIADRSMDADKTAALVGGRNNLGILTMKDRVIDDLMANPFNALDMAFEPGDGEPLLITDQEKSANNVGRECWLQWLGAYAGSARIALV